jgi:predicted nucleic acid-binding protein
MPSSSDRVVVADTACLIGLANIDRIDILRQMYGTVVVTPEVAEEYGCPLPEWVTVQAAFDSNKTSAYSNFLGAGEASSISLATQTANTLLIIDDKRARRLALDLGLEITGTLGLLVLAYKNGIIQDPDSVVASLREIGFRLPGNAESLVKALLFPAV